MIEELLKAAEQLGHEVVFKSTNGYKKMLYWDTNRAIERALWAKQFLEQGNSFDFDITYTVPQNFEQRFLESSKHKMAIYAYESSIMPEKWRQYYKFVDYVLPPSKYCADMIKRNGCPEDKIVIVPHGVDTEQFSPQVEGLKINTEKKIKFLCVAEPHYRKQIDKLLDLYCRTFSSKDDVCLVLKTKIFANEKDYERQKEFEIDLKPHLLRLKKKYGNSMPELKIISKRLENIASLYTACDAFALMTASEGWGMPYLEALACGLPVIAPNFGGQLEFLNKDNAILTKCGVRRAKPQEQYWGFQPKATVGNPDEKDFASAMRKMYEVLVAGDKAEIAKLSRMRESGLETAKSMTWMNAISKIIEIGKR